MALYRVATPWLLTDTVFLLQWVASIDVVENEEASASVIVKMTDSFTEQADQVILKGPALWQERPRGGSQAVLFANSEILES